MFHKSGPTHLGWPSRTAGLPRRLKPIGVALSTFCTGRFSPRSLAQAIIADQLCGPLWAPVNQGASSLPRLSVQVENFNWSSTKAAISLPLKLRKGGTIELVIEIKGSLLASIHWSTSRMSDGEICQVECSQGRTEGQEVARVKWRDYVLQQVIGPSLLLIWRNPGCFFSPGISSITALASVWWSAIYFSYVRRRFFLFFLQRGNVYSESRNQSRQVPVFSNRAVTCAGDTLISDSKEGYI